MAPFCHEKMQQQRRVETIPITHTGFEITQKRWVKTEIGYKCDRCGYYSERRSNVERHFQRIHCQLKKYKTCICEKKFSTKGEYYEHCSVEHPNSRHSWLVTTKKYKMNKQNKVKSARRNINHSVESTLHSSIENNTDSSMEIQEFSETISLKYYIREYLSLIDFEMLDAILSLKYLSKSKS